MNSTLTERHDAQLGPIQCLSCHCGNDEFNVRFYASGHNPEVDTVHLVCTRCSHELHIMSRVDTPYEWSPPAPGRHERHRPDPLCNCAPCKTYRRLREAKGQPIYHPPTDDWRFGDWE